MSLLNTKGIRIIFKNGDNEHIDPVLTEERTPDQLKVYNGYYTYSYELSTIERTEYYDPSKRGGTYQDAYGN